MEVKLLDHLMSLNKVIRILSYRGKTNQWVMKIILNVILHKRIFNIFKNSKYLKAKILSDLQQVLFKAVY